MRFRSRRRYKKHNPFVGSLTSPISAMTAGFSLDTAKTVGFIVVGGIATKVLADLLFDKLVSRLGFATSGPTITKASKVVTTLVTAGGVATLASKVLPFRSSELLEGGMLAAAAQLLPDKVTIPAVKVPGMSAWSDELGLGPGTIGEFPSLTAVRRAGVAEMGDELNVGQAGRAFMYGMGDSLTAGQARSPVPLGGMDSLVADEIMQQA